MYKQCTELKQTYDACYTTWFTEKFLNGETDEGMCAPLFKLYQNCLKVLITYFDNFTSFFQFISCKWNLVGNIKKNMKHVSISGLRRNF